MGFLKTVIGGAIGFMVGGPLGAAGGAMLANVLGDDDNKYKIMCPHCKGQLGVDKYGRYECCHCNEVLIFDENGVVKDKNFTVICPYCESKVLIEKPGKWLCPDCNKEFVYESDKFKEDDYYPDNVFLFLIFALFAKIAKANGVIIKDHISVIEEIINHDFEFNGEERKEVIDYFRKAKDSNTSFEEYCIKLNDMIKESEDYESAIEIKEAIIDKLFKICNANTNISNEQNRLINFTVSLFNINEYVVNEIRKSYFNSDIDKYYKILECKAGDSFEIVKRQYKKLAMEYHPDKIESMNLPQYLKDISNQKFQELQQAYEYIKNSIK